MDHPPAGFDAGGLGHYALITRMHGRPLARPNKPCARRLLALVIGASGGSAASSFVKRKSTHLTIEK